MGYFVVNRRVLAFAGVSVVTCLGAQSVQAQNKVELYGIVDNWVGVQNNRSVTAPGATGVVEASGAQTSRWGVRGSEELGGGLKAQFVLEQGLLTDTGIVNTTSGSNQGFNRASYVQLMGGFGDVRLGRMLTAYDAMRGSMNQLYDAPGFASTGATWGAGTTAANGLAAVTGSDYLSRTNNTIYYGTPEYRNFSGSVSFAAGEDTTTATASPRVLTTNITYDDKKLRAGYSFQKEHYTTGANVYHLMSGKYDFGRFKMVGSLQRQKDERVAGGQTSREYQFGVDVPLGAATVAFGIAGAKTRNALDTTVVDAAGYSAMATYDLSKRTRLYTAARQLKVKRGDGSTSSDILRWGVGVTHRF